MSSCGGQTKENIQRRQLDKTGNDMPVGGPFENREFIYQGMPEHIGPVDTSAGWKQEGQKILLTGVVYRRDGQTPAPGVILYYYHTDISGRYVHGPGEERSMSPDAAGRTHGYIRGWVRTDAAGRYRIYTVMPGVYPSGDEPAHVHATVKEPNDINEYYIDDFVFDDDRLLTSARRKKMENRCGSGVLRMVGRDGLYIGERDIILGLHIPGYPGEAVRGPDSGREVGEDVLSFTPYHAWGPDKGKRTCPVCKYGWYHGVLYFVGNHPDWTEIKEWLRFLEAESRRREKYLKVCFVYGHEREYENEATGAELERLGQELNLGKVALTFVPSFSDTGSEVDLNKINPAVGNTFILYRRNRITDKFVDLKPGNDNFNLIARRLDQTINEYFDLARPGE